MSDLLLKRKRITPAKPRVSAESQFATDRFMSEKDDNRRLLDTFYNHWNNLSDVRARANRNYQYVIGNQWYETILIEYKNGKREWVTEADYIRSQGRVPFVHNIMLPINTNIIGQFEQNPSQSIVKARNREDQAVTDQLSAALDESLDANNIPVMEPAQVREYLNSGVLCTKIGWEYWPTRDKSDLKITPVNYNNIAWDQCTDARGESIGFFGAFYDVPIQKIISTFAMNKADEEAIRNMYPGSTDAARTYATAKTGTGEDTTKNDFYNPSDLSLCRVYEIWEKRIELRMREHDRLHGTLTTTTRKAKAIDVENLERERKCIEQGVEYDPYLHSIEYEERYEEIWFYKYITPQFACLGFGESPYEHQSHPFVLTPHPLLNGRIWGFNETLIDSQRQLNRLHSLQDAILGGSAKNFTAVSSKALEGKDTEDRESLTDQLSQINGLAIIDPGVGGRVSDAIHNFTGNSASLGISDLINNQINQQMQISGVSPAAQGQKADSGTPSSRYAMETANSQVNLIDLFSTIRHHRKLRDEKALSVIIQYKPDSILKSNKLNKETQVYESAKVKALKDISVEVSSAVDTPIYRALKEDRLMELTRIGLIPDVRILAELSSEEWAEPLLEILNKMQAEQPPQPGAQHPQMKVA